MVLITASVLMARLLAVQMSMRLVVTWHLTVLGVVVVAATVDIVTAISHRHGLLQDDSLRLGHVGRVGIPHLLLRRHQSCVRVTNLVVYLMTTTSLLYRRLWNLMSMMVVHVIWMVMQLVARHLCKLTVMALDRGD